MLVDRTGHVVTGPVSLPAGRFVVGVTAAGLVLQPHLQSDQSFTPEPIEVWDPLHRRVVRLITDSGFGVLTADSSTVVWVAGNTTPSDLTDMSSGADRAVPVRGYRPDLEGGVFSPDGSRLAITMRSLDGLHTVPAVIEVGSGAPNIGTSDDFPPYQAGLITWTAAGDRIFVSTDSNAPNGQIPHLPTSGHRRQLSPAPGHRTHQRVLGRPARRRPMTDGRTNGRVTRMKEPS